MAFRKSQAIVLLCCIVAVSADFAAKDLRRFAKAKKELGGDQRPLRRLLRPLNKPLSGPVAAESRIGERFSGFGLNDGELDYNFGQRPNFQGQYARPQGQRDGAEYDEYGNRKKQSYGLGSATIPRGYLQDDAPYEQQPQEQSRPAYPYNNPRRTIDSKRKAVIDEIDPAYYEELEGVPEYPVQPTQPRADAQPRVDRYAPASGPAFAPSNLNPVFANARQDLGPGSLEASIHAGADAYGAHANPEGVYQNEDRLSFQIHGQEGPHSYRYGYDTGSGYNRQFRYEERNGQGYVKGRYGFFDKYGKLQVVNYHADPVTGFHAEGAHVPHH